MSNTKKATSTKGTSTKMRLALGLVLLAILVLGFTITNLLSQKNTSQTPTPSKTVTRKPVIPPKLTFTPEQQKLLVASKVLTRFQPDVEQAVIDKELSKNNAELTDVIPGINTAVLKVPVGKENEVIQNLYDANIIEYAERSFYGQEHFTPNDTSFASQYNLKQVQAEQAWDITKGAGIKVAIIDSGVDLTHPDLQSKIAASKDFSGTGSMIDESEVGHGTHLSGIVGAQTNNALGIAGVCPDCQILFAKQGDSFDQETISQGLIWSADQGAKAINMSFESQDGQTLRDAVAYAWGKGAIPVAAPANDGTNNPEEVPSSLPNVVSVAATDQTDNKTSYSNYGDWVTIAAPGDKVLSTLPNGEYGNLSGTSMASPVVVGIIGLVAATPYGTSPASIVQRICDTADKITGTGTEFKCGRINAFKAVQGAVTPTTPIGMVPSANCLGSCPTLPPTATPVSVASPTPIDNVTPTETSPDDSLTPIVDDNPDDSLTPIVDDNPDESLTPIVDDNPDDNLTPIIDDNPNGNQDNIFCTLFNVQPHQGRKHMGILFFLIQLILTLLGIDTTCA